MGASPRDLYLDLMQRVVTNTIYQDHARGWAATIHEFKDELPHIEFDEAKRDSGQDIPAHAHTMIGTTRLGNLRRCVERVLADDVPGDLIETGVWRGGATIFMRAILKAHDVDDRRVWVADSFAGVPEPDPAAFPVDRIIPMHVINDVLAVSEEEVRENFRRYDLLDDQVRLLSGYFRDTLPGAPIERLSVMRLDGDMYQSTFEALTHLYPRLSPGGYVIVDDYHALLPCRMAVHEYREAHGVTETIEEIDGTAVYWRREG
ncbi:TylF/MycF family methyltransferase [Spiractinospora alimapuensis]|uniref:TylF/MycF family methyltransferase n=1 Tax=Spiractinospora alimapuensis TaxID=2820884 RepID=UPI001F362DAE|nr:TylF/MycF family methyltransferase [Spiractinospora alimapuensis]QVQ51834.1 TylF/MycF family methyltransferase [Spiractinospora alimapuensis]